MYSEIDVKYNIWVVLRTKGLFSKCFPLVGSDVFIIIIIIIIIFAMNKPYNPPLDGSKTNQYYHRELPP